MPRLIISKLKLSLVLLVASSFAANFVHAEFDERPSVVALFGDSITVGENVTTYYFNCGAIAFGPPSTLAGRPGFGFGRSDYCNPDRELSDLLNDSRRPATVVNHGIGGSQTPSGVSRIVSNLNQTRTAYPNGSNYLVMILYGTNDVSSGVGPFTIGFNTLQMIDLSRAAGWTPVIGSLLPRTNRSSGIIAANQQIQAAANARGASFVDQFNNFQAKGGLNLHDEEGFLFNRPTFRLHPSVFGYKVIAQQWFDAALENLIAPIPVPPPPPPPVAAPILLLLLDEDEPPSS